MEKPGFLSNLQIEKGLALQIKIKQKLGLSTQEFT